MKVYNVSDGPLLKNDKGGILGAGEWGEVSKNRAERYLEAGLVVRERQQQRSTSTRRSSSKTKDDGADSAAPEDTTSDKTPQE